MPRDNEVPILIEYLNTEIPTIGDIDPVLRTANEDVVRLIELFWCRTSVPPSLNEPAVFAEFNNTSGAELVREMAIRDEDVAIRRDGDASRTVECVRAVAGNTRLTQHHQNFAIGVQLEDFLAHDVAGVVPGRHAEHRFTVVDIARPKVSVVVDGKSVRIRKQSRTEAFEKNTRRVEFQDRRIGLTAINAGGAAGRHDIEATMKYPDVAVACDMHPDDLSPATSIHAVRQSRPTFHQTVRVRQFCRFMVRGLLGMRHHGPRRE